MNILGLIPARGGSKSIPKKNLAPISGRPLIAYTISAAKDSKRLTRFIVSTDDGEIAEVAKSLGAEAPFLRPSELARDDSTALSVIRHSVEYLQKNDGWRSDIVVYLQPTSPLRRGKHIDEAVDLLLKKKADTIVSVISVPHQFNPVSLMKMEGEYLKPFMSEKAHLLQRQYKPVMYARNGPAILASTYETLIEQNRLYGEKVVPYIMEEKDSVDVDTLFDLDLAEWLLKEER